ncbi:MAG: O-antigen ligase family protein [Ornithinimicrobium sp.]
MTLVLVVVAVLAVLLLVRPVVGTWNTPAALVVGSVCFLPVTLYATSERYHVGIAAPAFEVRTFTVVIVCCWVLAALSKVRVRPGAGLVVFVGYLWIAYLFVWPQTSESLAGAMHLTLGALAFSLGVWSHRAGGATSAHVMSRICFLVVAVQVVVTALQFAGVPINAVSGSDAEFLGNRVNGTSNHPNNLGKMIYLLGWMSLVWTKSDHTGLRRCGYGVLFLGLLPLALAAGRANLAATLVMILLWVLLQPRSSPVPGGRAVVLGMISAMVGAVFILISRFDSDPTSGVRGVLIRLALDNLPTDIWFGVGPNTYVTAMSPRTGSFIPVHNVFLLELVEIGVAGLLLLLLPIVVLLVRSVARLSEVGERGDYSRAFVSGVPGILLISATGWGIIGTGMLPLLAFVVGVLHCGVAGRDEDAQDTPSIPRTTPSRSDSIVSRR